MTRQTAKPPNRQTAKPPNRQTAITAMQSLLGREYVIQSVTTDNDGDWIADITPIDNDAEIVGSVYMAADGYSDPIANWD